MDEQSERGKQSGASRDLHRVATDIIIERDAQIVLIKRKFEPFKGHWCLPGGHVEYGEQVRQAAEREATEETGLAVTLESLLGIYDAPGRDPRGPVISIVYTATTNQQELDPDTDAADAAWFSRSDFPADLGFDHEQILTDYKEQRSRQ